MSARKVSIIYMVKTIMTDANSIYTGYKNSIKGSKWKTRTQQYSIDFLKEIFKLQEELENQTYKPRKETSFILRERGKIRPITSIKTRDRIVRHILCDEILMPKIKKHIIYDNGSSVKGRGLDFSRKRFDIHIREYCAKTGSNEGYILFGDFRKFYDNIVHDIAKKQLLELFNDDKYLEYLLDIIFKNFQIDVSYMDDSEYDNCINVLFDKLEYYKISNKVKTGQKWMAKSANIGDQISQDIGIFYPNRIDQYVKTVLGQKYYGRYTDDFYVIDSSKERLKDILSDIEHIANDLGLFINHKKTAIVKLDKPFTYLQLRYYVTPTGRITKKLSRTRIQSMKSKLRKMSKLEDVTFDEAAEMFRSWMGAYYKLLPNQTRLEFLALFEDLFDCTITIVNDKLIFA